jgi:DNA-binding response OmpR family regulator
VLLVEPKAFRVLLYLLRNPGKPIGKEESRNAVWGVLRDTGSGDVYALRLLEKWRDGEQGRMGHPASSFIGLSVGPVERRS